MSRGPHPILWPRRGEPWTSAEDERLLGLVRDVRVPQDEWAPTSTDKPDWRAIAKTLGRNSGAVQNRFYLLRAGLRLAQFRSALKGSRPAR